MVVSNDSDRVRLCGEALVRLNGETISSFEDGSRAAAICAVSYERIYHTALTANRWSFTLVRKLLAPLADYHPLPHGDMWAYKYQLPADCINFIGVMFSYGDDGVSLSAGYWPVEQGGRLDRYSVEFEERDGCIYANHGHALVEYQYAVDESMLRNEPLFRNYLVCSLAAEFAISIMNDSGKMQLFSALAQDALALAASTDSNRNPTAFTNYSATVLRMGAFG
jgi:hypothetical protein